MRTLSEILEWIGIEQLSRTPNGFKGCCAVNPDHIDNKPSMYIHVEKGYVKCFSCGKFRPLFDFLLDHDVPFDEAVEFMFTQFDQEERETEELTEWVLGRKIPKSMLDRGLTKETLRHFRVGYDEVNQWITIPNEYKGKLLGIGYRQYPKRFWSSEGFVKDNYIYNFEPTEERTYVEGYTDTWTTWQNGCKEVSAPLTANVSIGQLSLMAQHKVINLGFDNDKAGWKGAFLVHRELGRDVEINYLPYQPKDPGACTYEQWQKAMANKVPFVEFEVRFIQRQKELYEQIQKELNGLKS